MKYLFFLLFSISIYAQDTLVNSKQSVIALDKMNVVYRGVENPISIAVNDAKSYTITGNGVKQKEDGSYTLFPGSGSITKVYIEITKPDDTVVVEEHEFRINSIPLLTVTLNSEFSTKGVLEFSLDELKNSKVGAKFIDFNFPVEIEIIGFSLKVPKFSTINVIGNTFTEEVFNVLKKSKKKDIIVIHNIKPRIKGFNIYVCKIPPIAFRILK